MLEGEEMKDIVDIAKEVGYPLMVFDGKPHVCPELERLVAAVRADEREACAKVCKKHADVYAGLEQNPATQSAWAACIDNHDFIRARGQA